MTCATHWNIVPKALPAIAQDWKVRLHEKELEKAVAILREKFATMDSFAYASGGISCPTQRGGSRAPLPSRLRACQKF